MGSLGQGEEPGRGIEGNLPSELPPVSQTVPVLMPGLDRAPVSALSEYSDRDEQIEEAPAGELFHSTRSADLRQKSRANYVPRSFIISVLRVLLL